MRRTVELARAAWGAALLLHPDRLASRSAPPNGAARDVVRLLGARQVLQGSLSAASPTPAVLAVGVWTDTVHALSAVAFAGVDRRRARPVLFDAAVAAGLAVLGGRLDRGPEPSARPGWLEQVARVVLPRLPGAPRVGRARIMTPTRKGPRRPPTRTPCRRASWQLRLAGRP